MMDCLLASAVGCGPVQIVVLDNASRDDSLAALKALSGKIELIVNAHNVGFGRANNQCLALARGRYVLLLNTDAFVAPDTLRKTLDYMDSHPSTGVLGARLVGRDGVLQASCRYFPTVSNVFLSRTGLERWFPWVHSMDDMSWNHVSDRPCDWVPGCYYLVRREVIDQVGLFDPRYFLYYEEVDHCRAVKAAGWGVTYFHDTTVVHVGGESAKSDSELTAGGRQISVLQIESELLYFRKHSGLGGLFVHLCLTLLAALILNLKSVFKCQGVRCLSAQWHHVRRVFALALLTRWGTRPTR
jgi:GT2 family glycosyltransferase